ncbi:hypothetical protein RFI_20199 [Reticulomyxa filosa]|uniref:Uncharacterized protein n=1 Tax=Reticulomyxa filosa TaxID=46433 RepID=X6MT20_RETFI|nr:hypothetical protein RFI_20199 [Reticulomyxa filosa]|eukprot:ETO17133.1 hypothetical protein RFI_20199 [Reticulomyxa filosa]
MLQKGHNSPQTTKYFELLDEWQENKDDKRRDEDSFYPRFLSRKEAREVWGFDDKNYEHFFPQDLIPLKRNTLKSAWNELVAHQDLPFVKADEQKLLLVNTLLNEIRPIIIYHFRKHVQGYVRIINMTDRDINGMLNCLRVRGCRCDNGSRQSHDCTSNGGRPPSWIPLFQVFRFDNEFCGTIQLMILCLQLHLWSPKKKIIPYNKSQILRYVFLLKFTYYVFSTKSLYNNIQWQRN